MDRNMDEQTQEEITGGGESRVLPALRLQAHEHPALPGTHDVIRRLNRDTKWVATGLLGTVFFAALLLALQELQPRQTRSYLLLNANPPAISNVMASNEKSTGEITPGQATGTDSGLTPKINQPDAQANATSWSPAQRPDSARVITKVPNVRLRSYLHRRYVDVKTRLIALWHQSLRREKSRGWALFSNSNKWQKEN
jgi:hypothetical protein